MSDYLFFNHYFQNFLKNMKNFTLVLSQNEIKILDPSQALKIKGGAPGGNGNGNNGNGNGNNGCPPPWMT